MSVTALKSNAVEKISISNYKVIELIGSGGMANIFKAIQLSLDRPVALKVMHQHLSMNEGFVTRFEKEAKQAAQLNHENIVSIIDYGHENGDYYIAMEYIDGRNLKQLLEKQNRLPLEISLLIGHQVAEGLKYAHSQNLVHRDIKPANIILSSDGRVMITDFGIAKGDDDLSITATGQMIGSPAYMSPEQAVGRPTDHRSDLFSLGIILYEMIAGEKPFKGETYQEMVTAIMSQYPVPLKKQRVDVNDEISGIVDKAIIKDKESRFQSADELSDALYAEFERFKLPSPRKLISTFLKNPGRMTEKLRIDKISNHMESALYYMTQGESRLKDARREFEDVLRFDKNNKSAKKYLSKLESQITEYHETTTTRRLIKYNKNFKFWLIVIVAVAAILAAWLVPRRDSGGTEDGKGTDNGAVSTNTDNAAKSTGGEQNKAGGDQNTKSSTDNTKSTGKKNTGVSDSQKNNTTKGNKTVRGYPNQNLSEYGSLTVKTNVPAMIEIDMIDYGSTNGPSIKLQPGRHFVEIKADGFRRMTRRIFTEKDQTVNLDIELIPEKR